MASYYDMQYSLIVMMLLAACIQQVFASTLTPPVLPLLVRNPYLSTWLSNAREAPWTKWPTFWTGQEVGFGILARVPSTNTAFPLLGRPHDSLPTNSSTRSYEVSRPRYSGATYDASTTNLTYQIPCSDQESDDTTAQVILSFLSPITPQSTLRQAIPAAYVTVHVESKCELDIYLDLNGLWVSGERESKLEWQLRYSQNDAIPIKSWEFKRRHELLFTESSDRAEWGSTHFSGPDDVQHESGTSALLRQRFARSGTLLNRVDKKFRSIMDEEPVFAFSKSFRFDNSSKAHADVIREVITFTIAHTQDPVVQYASARGLTLMRPLWKSWFSSEESLVQYHYQDYKHARALARNYSDQLAIDAYRSGSSNYRDIAALSARQVLGATVFSGTLDDPFIFLKEISSNGNCQTVDVIFPAFPFFLYTNPRWAAYLLEPLIEHQLSGQYPNKYSMHDLGAHFPNQTGHSDGDDEYMPVEECGDMLIMGLALVNSLRYDTGYQAQSMWSDLGDDVPQTLKKTGSVFPLTSHSTIGDFDHLDMKWGGATNGVREARQWVQRAYRLWTQWTGYLVDFSLEPHNQLSTDDFAGWLALQTNLALKGIVGIKAMSELAQLTGNRKDARYYHDVANDYIKKWEDYGMSRDKSHAKLAYNWHGSWTTLYSLFADTLLCFHPTTTGPSQLSTLSDDSSLDATGGLLKNQVPMSNREESDFTTARKDDFIPHYIYTNQSRWYELVMQKYGLPLDSRHLYTKSDWQFEAAAVAERPVRAQVLDRVANWINETATDQPLSDLFETEGDGGFPGIYFIARPVVGGHFAFLALERACGRGHGD